MRLFLVRHGQTAWNLAGRAQGHTDEPLDEAGRLQSSLLAESFSGQMLDLILCSDLQRCRQTAEALAARTNGPLETTQLLRERSFGELEGADYSQVRDYLDSVAKASGLEHYDVRPPGGESVLDVWERLKPIVERLETARLQSVAVVSHGGAAALLLSQMLRGTIWTARSLRFGNTSVTELLRRPNGTWQLLRYADTTHLDAPSAPMIDAYQPINS